MLSRRPSWDRRSCIATFDFQHQCRRCPGKVMRGARLAEVCWTQKPSSVDLIHRARSWLFHRRAILSAWSRDGNDHSRCDLR